MTASFHAKFHPLIMWGPFTFIKNCILWNDSPQEIYLSNSTVNVTYSDIQGGYAGEGNLNLDPLLVDPEAEDYRLPAGSACLDTGTGNGATATDIDGHLRPAGLGYDMGAYEYGVRLIYLGQFFYRRGFFQTIFPKLN